MIFRRISLALAGLLALAQPVAAQVKVSQLPVATAPTGTELLPVVQGGATKQVTVSALFSASRLNMSQVATPPSDSRGAQYSASVSSPEVQKASSPLAYGMALSDQRLTQVYLGGISGNTVAQYLAANSPDPRYAGQNNLEAYLSTKAGIGYYPPPFANDIGQLVPKETTWAAYKAMLDRDAATGRYMLLTLEIGSPAFTPTQVGMMHWLNGQIRQWAQGKPRAIVIDAPAVIWDPTNTSTTAIVHKAGYSDGGPHFNTAGAHAVGQLVADAIKLIAPAQPHLARAAHEIWANGGIQANQSPTGLVTVAAPSNANGITYNTVLPAGMTIQRGLNAVNLAGAATATVDLIDDPNGMGKALRITATWTQVGEYIQIDSTWASAVLTGLTAGDKLWSGAKVKVAAGSVNSTAPWAYTRIRADGVDYVSSGLQNDPGVGGLNLGADYTTAYDYELRTGSVTVPTYASITIAFQRIRMQSTGVGSQTATFSQISGWRELAAQ